MRLNMPCYNINSTSVFWLHVPLPTSHRFFPHRLHTQKKIFSFSDLSGGLRFFRLDLLEATGPGLGRSSSIPIHRPLFDSAHQNNSAHKGHLYGAPFLCSGSILMIMHAFSFSPVGTIFFGCCFLASHHSTNRNAIFLVYHRCIYIRRGDIHKILLHKTRYSCAPTMDHLFVSVNV